MILFIHKMIPIESYKEIADLINSSQERGQEIVAHFDQMREDIADSEVDDENIDKRWLYEEINRIYDEVDLFHNEYTSELFNFVKQLQIHVTTGYGSVNSFLRDNGETVFSIFADISNEVGYEIDADLILSESDFCGAIS